MFWWSAERQAVLLESGQQIDNSWILQVDCAPRPLAAGQCFSGLLLWHAMTWVGQPLGEAVRQGMVPAAEAQSMARQCLEKLHATGLLHGTPTLGNFSLQGGVVRMTGLGQARVTADQDELKAEADALDVELEGLRVRNSAPPLCSGRHMQPS